MDQNTIFSKDLYLFGCSFDTVTDMINEIIFPDQDDNLDIKKQGRIIKVTLKADTEDILSIKENLLRESGIGAHIAPDGITSQNEALVYYLKKRGLTLSLAESCTGGLCAARIVDVSGASDVFIGSSVCYANSAKTAILGVKKKTLETYGAVSKHTASEMARGARNVFSSDIAVSVTGIAGPGGGSEQKPVGTVYFGYSSKNGEQVLRLQFNDYGRDYIRNKSVEFMIYTVLKHII